MSVTRVVGFAAVVLLLGSCGGGGDSATPPPVTVNPQPSTPTLAVSLSATGSTQVVQEGGEAKFGFTASYTGTSSSPVVPEVQINDRRLTLDGAPVQSGNSIQVALKTAAFPAGGSAATQIRFRLCTSADCSTVYPGSTQNYAVTLDVQLKEWATFQRDNAHRGYVAVRYKTTDFQKAWDWQGPADGRIRPPAASGDKVLVSAGRNGGMSFNDTAKLHALKAADGSTAWTYNLGNQFHLSGPSVANGLVHLTSMESSSETNPQWVFDLQTGAFREMMNFASQWHAFNQPTVVGTDVYLAAGYYGGVVYGFDAATGRTRFATERPGVSFWLGQSVAADATSLYYYSGEALDVLDRTTGALIKSIPDRKTALSSTDYEAGPVLDGQGNVFLFASGRRFTDPGVIHAISLQTNKILWASAAQYTTAFAYRDNVIYAARNDARVLSAIDARNGQVLWSASLPTQDVLTGNVVITESHAFVSSEDKTWAIDLLDPAHPVVWEAPTGGRLAITPTNLLLTTGMNRLTAYRLF